ncbi:MAG: dTDP-glucose 4,6-dehydratase [Rhodothermales bacterium]
MPTSSELQHRPKTVLVTGGAGFIGSNYLLHVVPKYPETTYVNVDALTYAGNLTNLRDIESAENYRFERADVADTESVSDLFDRYDFSTVVHFAAESHVDRSILDPLAFVRSNVMGTATLLDACRKKWMLGAGSPSRFHHVSTDEVFGSLGQDGYFEEDTPYDPKSPYSASKAGSDHLVRAYAHTFGLPVVLSNCSNNYGPFQFPEKLIPLVIRNAADGRPIPVYGKGENVRDWIYVQDHVEALDLILRSGVNGHTYLVGGRSERANIDIVRIICRHVDEALDRAPGSAEALINFVTDRPGHDFRYAIDCSRIENDLGWSPRFRLEEGLAATVEWYLTHRTWLDAVLNESYLAYYQTQYASR